MRCLTCGEFYKSFENKEKECRKCDPLTRRLCCECGIPITGTDFVYNMCNECVIKYMADKKKKEIPTEKVCRTCEKMLNESEYYRYKHRDYNLYPDCKKCYCSKIAKGKI